MDNWWRLVMLIAVPCAAACLLYCRGIAVTKNIRALLFVFRPGKEADRAVLDSCNGWVRHVGRFRESRTYEFILETSLSRGDAELVLLDRKKQPLLALNRRVPAGKIKLDGNARYYLRWEFRDATGQCELRW